MVHCLRSPQKSLFHLVCPVGSFHHPTWPSGEPLSWDDVVHECASGVNGACGVDGACGV